MESYLAYGSVQQPLTIIENVYSVLPGHALTLETLGYSFDVTVYFAAHESFTRNVLGRRGWLDQSARAGCGTARCGTPSPPVGRW